MTDAPMQSCCILGGPSPGSYLSDKWDGNQVGKGPREGVQGVIMGFTFQTQNDGENVKYHTILDIWEYTCVYSAFLNVVASYREVMTHVEVITC